MSNPPSRSLPASENIRAGSGPSAKLTHAPPLHRSRSSGAGLLLAHEGLNLLVRHLAVIVCVNGIKDPPVESGDLVERDRSAPIRVGDCEHDLHCVSVSHHSHLPHPGPHHAWLHHAWPHHALVHH